MKASLNNRNNRQRRSGIDSSPKLVVQHNYVDHYYDAPFILENESQQGKQGKRRGPRGGVVSPFCEKLYYMLSQAEPQGFEDIVSWQPHGRCFIIHQPKSFVETVMPKFFNQSKLTSFQRQVNLYGFRRLTAGRDRGAYYHELFLRGRPDLAKKIVRMRVKGTGCKSAASPETEPCFYSQYHPCLENTIVNHAVAGSYTNASSNEGTAPQKDHENAPLEPRDYQLQDLEPRPLKGNYKETDQDSNDENPCKLPQTDCRDGSSSGGNMSLLKSMSQCSQPMSFWMPPPPPFPRFHHQASQNEDRRFHPLEPMGNFLRNDETTQQEHKYKQDGRDGLSPFPMSTQHNHLFQIQDEVISLMSPDREYDSSHSDGHNDQANSQDYPSTDPLFMLGDSFQQTSV